MVFGCVIVYKMYIYDVFPSKHFVKLSFLKNEFWAHIKECYFEFYVKLLHGEWADAHNPKTEGSCNPSNKKCAPIEVVQSEPEEMEGVLNQDMAEEEVVIQINHRTRNRNRSAKRHASLSESTSNTSNGAEGDSTSTSTSMMATTIDPTAISNRTTRTRTNAVAVAVANSNSIGIGTEFTESNQNENRSYETDRDTDGVHRTSSDEDIFLTVSVFGQWASARDWRVCGMKRCGIARCDGVDGRNERVHRFGVGQMDGRAVLRVDHSS